MNQVKFYFSLIVGTLIIALSFNVLQGPNQIASGGLPGTSLVLSSTFHLPSSIILWAITFIILVISSYFLGIKSIGKSIFGSLLIPLFVNLTTGLPALTSDPLLASIYGGVGVGVGLGIVIRVGGNVGGFSLIAQILYKMKSVKHSTSLLVMDGTVIIAGGIIFSPEIALYALVGAFITRKTMDIIIHGDKKGSKVAYIITSKEYEKKIEEKVLHDLDRGLTKISGVGGYTNSERAIMMIVLNPVKSAALRAIVQEIDPGAFIILCEATEVFGEGFSHSFQPRVAKTNVS